MEVRMIRYNLILNNLWKYFQIFIHKGIIVKFVFTKNYFVHGFIFKL